MLDLDRRTSKYEQEQAKRREEAKRKKEKEDRLAEAQKRRELEAAALASKRKEEQEAAEIARQLAEAEEMRATGGVKFHRTLTPYASEGDDDKVILPEDCLPDLTEQDVFGKRPVLFQLKALFMDESSRVTHCGMREFSAPAGTIGLPTKIVNTLNGDVSLIKSIDIKYVILSKVTSIKLKPKENHFFDVGPVKRMLEENLVLHSTISEGDLLTVWYRGNSHHLIVKEVHPDPQGSLLDTDVAVDIDVSEEHDKLAIASKPEHSQGRTLGQAPGHVGALETATVAPPSPPSAELPPLLPEPEVGTPGTLLAKFKLPSGKTISRRFLHSYSVKQIFYFLQHELQLSDLSSLNISTRFPPRTLSCPTHDESIESVGLGLDMEQLFVKY